ncbi:MAG: hypothetical protein ACI85O_001432 [Saprospiraceae bacterium]|jgi:hypothetical protein
MKSRIGLLALLSFIFLYVQCSYEDIQESDDCDINLIEELKNAIGANQRPNVDRALYLIDEINNREDFEDIPELEEISRQLLEKFKDDTKVTVSHYTSPYWTIKSKTERAALNLLMKKNNINELDEKFDFAASRVRTVYREKDYTPNAGSAETNFIKENASDFIPYIIEEIKEEMDDVSKRIFIYALREDNVDRVTANKAMIKFIENGGEKYLNTSMLCAFNVTIQGSNEISEKVRVFLTDFMESLEAKGNFSHCIRKKGRPIQPEEKGRDLSILDNQTITEEFLSLDFDYVFLQTFSKFNEDYILLRKFAIELGNRKLANKYEPTEAEKLKITDLVNHYIELYYSKTPQCVVESTLQVLRLWDLAIPTLIENLDCSNSKEQSFAVNFLKRMRDEEVTDIILQKAQQVNTPEQKMEYNSILGMMQYYSTPQIKDRPYLSKEEVSRIYREKVAPVRATLQ